MALIDLRLIGKLSIEGLQQKTLLDSISLVPERDLDLVTFAFLYKGYVQSDNLYNGLARIHQICTDMAADNVLPYYERHQVDMIDCPEDEREDFDAFKEILRGFYTETIHDLPYRIEQYPELVQMAAKYGEVQTKMKEGFNKFFAGIQPHYLMKDENGQEVMVPSSELPEDVLNQIKVNQQIGYVDVEYCLDNYNVFYDTCIEILKRFETFHNYKEAATEILKLFAPFESSLTEFDD